MVNYVYYPAETMSRKPRDYIADPLIGPLLRMPLQQIRTRMRAGVNAAGFRDIGAAHFHILQHPTPHGCRPGEIAARAQMTKQATNRLIRDLERGGYLKLVVDPRDQRARVIRLTARGRDLISTIRAVVEQIEAEWRDRIGRRRFEELRATLKELVD